MDETPRSWALYFNSEEEFDLADKRVCLIQALLQFWIQPTSWDDFLCKIKTGKDLQLTLSIDFHRLCVLSKIADLEPACQHAPTDFLGCIGASVYEVLFESAQYTPRLEERLGFKVPPSKIRIQPYNVPSSQCSIRGIQSDHIGRLVCIKGTVVRMMPCQPAPIQLEYACTKCHKRVMTDVANCRPEPPKACSTGCRSKAFQPVLETMKTTDWQKVRIQELLAVTPQEAHGSAARTIDAELNGDSVRSCVCGDVVSVLGFVRVMSVDQGSKARSGIMLLYLDVVSLVNHTADESMAFNDTEGVSARGLTMKDLHFVCTFARTCAPQQLLHLAHSLCPGILGHGLVKVGLILSLLGGAGAPMSAEGKGTRDAIHVLLVGDPGLGKSQLLRAAAAAAPRGMYVCSTTSTSAGLTVSVAKDVVTNDMALEAGALVLADNGVCCLDELDNMRSEHKTLLEVMEQQQVCVAKAGMTAQMPARTTVIAAANPNGGKYSEAKTLQENLKMSPALFSRFDLIYAMVDGADEEQDAALSRHVMRVHAGDSAEPEVMRLTGSECHSHAAESLKARVENFHCTNPLPKQLIRKYVGYARRYCHPELSHEAKLVLKEFYLEIRQLAASCPQLPVTARHLDSMMRLARARARADLRSEVTRADAEEVVALMKESMRDLFRDSIPFVHVPCKGHGRKAAGMGRLVAALTQKKQSQGKCHWTVAELHGLADDLGLQGAPIADMIRNLNDAGELLKKGPQLYSVP